MPEHILLPYKLNETITLKNRIVMAPMTRNMANADWVPTSEMAAYYARRADAGLIITEGTLISPDAGGFTNVPGIYTKEQIKGWRQVTNSVHANNGLIFLQLWHVGRVSHPYFLGGKLPISASKTLMTEKVKRRDDLFYGKSRAATLVEIAMLIDSYRQAANNAIKAGFDGVEIHGANGYLIDQFLHYDTNHRLDEYGIIPENMAKFALEVVKACGEEIGYRRVGIRLSPGAHLNEIKGDSRDAKVFEYLLKELNKIPIVYVHTGNFNDVQKFPELDNMTMTTFMRRHYQERLIACGSYKFEHAQQAILQGKFDMIALGRSFIANPDLIKRLQNQEELKEYHPELLKVLH